MQGWIGAVIGGALVLGAYLGFRIGQNTERARVERLEKKKRVDPRREPD